MKREWDSGDGVGGKKEVMEAESVPGVPGVEGRILCVLEEGDGGGRYVGTIMNGRRMLERREVMANIRRAKVPTRVAASQAALISPRLI